MPHADGARAVGFLGRSSVGAAKNTHECQQQRAEMAGHSLEHGLISQSGGEGEGINSILGPITFTRLQDQAQRRACCNPRAEGKEKLCLLLFLSKSPEEEASSRVVQAETGHKEKETEPSSGRDNQPVEKNPKGRDHYSGLVGLD